MVTESIQEGWLLSLLQPNLQLPSAGHLAGQPGKAITVIKDREFMRFAFSNIYHLIVQNTLFKSKAEKNMTARISLV